MADFDAGTARAHVRVDGDSRGADQATRAVEGFQRALEFIAGHLGGFVAAMDKIEGELNNVQGDFKDAADAADKYDRALNDVNLAHVRTSKSTNDLGRNIEDLHKRLKFAHDAWADYGIPILQATRAANEFAKTKGGVVGAIQAINRAGIAGAAMAAVKSHFIGMGFALRQAPVWQQQLARVAQNMGLVTLAGMRVGAVVPLLERGFARIVRGAEGADFAIAGFARTVGGLGTATAAISRFFGTLDKVPTGLFQLAGGMAVASSGMRSLQQRFRLLTALISGGGGLGTALRFVLLPGIILSQAATQTLDYALRGLSNTVAGLWSGIKQLAGGFLALPGLIATIGAAAIPMVAIVKTITSNFKDMIKAVSDNDVEKFAQAMQKIPPYLRPLAQAVANAIGPLKSLGDILTATFVSSGLDRQFTQLVNAWLPAVSTGADQVANSWKIMTNYLAGFLGEAKTIGAVNTIFMNTSQILNTVGASIEPIAAGLRDIAVVGSTFIRDLAATYLPQIANKFGQWAQNAAASGKAMQWMNNSVAAVKNLYTIADQTVRALYTLLTLFQTQPGDTWLHRVAVEMTKFNDTVNKSKASGELKKIADSVKGMGTDKIHELWQMFKDMLPTVRAVLQTLSDMGQAFSAIMLPAIQLLLPVLSALIQGLNDLGVGSAVGGILGVVKAFGLLRAVVGPLWDMFKIGFGLKTAFTGAQNVILGLAGTLERMGGLGQKAANGLLGIGSSIEAMAGPIGLAIAAIVAGFALWSQNNAYIAAGNKEIADSAEHATEATQKLRDAFVQDKGQIGKTVIQQYADNMKVSMQDIQNQASKAPGIMDHIGQLFRTDSGNNSWNPFAESDAFNDMQKIFDQSKKVQEGLQGLGVSANQVADAITSGSPKIDEWANKAQSMGDSGKAAADWLEQQKLAFDRMAQSAAAAGPGALAVSQGLDKIAQSGGDATSRLEGLKTVLQGLGLLQEDAYQSAANLAKSVDDLGNAAKNAADNSQSFDNIIDKNTGTLNVWTANGRNLLNVLAPLAQNFLAAANSGTDVQAAYQKIQDQLPALADSFHQNIGDIQRLLASLGVDPKIVNILLQVQGKDQVTQEIAKVLVTAEANIGNGVQVPVNFKTDDMAREAADAINKIFGPGSVTQQNSNIFLKPGIDPAAIAKLEQFLASKGIKLTPDSPNPPPGATATVPVAPTPSSPQTPLNVPAPGNPPPAKGPTAAPPAPPAPKTYDLPPGLAAIYPGLTKQPKAPKGSDKQPTPLPPGVTLPPGMTPPQAPTPAPSIAPVDTPTPAPMTPPPPPPPITPGTPPAGQQPVAAPQGPGQPINIPIQVQGMDQFGKIQDAFKALGDTLAKNIGQWMAWSAGVAGALASALSSVNQVTDAMTAKAKSSGEAWTNDFAAGLNSPNAIQKVIDAVNLVMQTVHDHAPHSPAKKGPLSGSGWSGYSGAAFSGDFAQGILGGQGAVGDAASKVAGKAAGALKPKTPYGSFNFQGSDKPPKDLTDMLKLVQNGFGLFKQVTDNVMSIAKFAMDPLGQANKAGGAGGLGKSQALVGSVLNQGIAGLGGIKNPSKQDIASAVAGEAQRRGYDRNTAIGILSAILQEDPSFNPNQQELGGSDHWGLFQQQGNYPGAHGGAAGQLQWMFDQLSSLGGPAAVNKDPLGIIANQIEKGGYGAGALAAHADAASKLYDSVLQTGALSGQGPYALPGIGSIAANPGSLASRVPLAPNVESGIQQVGGLKPLYAPGSSAVPAWMQQLAGAFGLTASTYPTGGSLHQMGFAADFNGAPADRERFAQFLQSNLASQTLQLIYQGAGGTKYGIASGQQVGPGTSQPGYYAGDFGQHTDHVHWATDVAPILAGANANSMPWAAGNMPNQQTTYGSQNPIQGTNVGTDLTPGPGNVAGTPNIGQDRQPGPGTTTDQLTGTQTQTGGQTQTPTNQTQQIYSAISSGMGNVSNVASSIIQTVQAGLDAWGATKYIADQMVRGISSTEDIYKLIDEGQKYLVFAADVANSAGQILSLAGSGSGADPSGASAGIAAAGQIMQMISAIITTVNASIDFGQEVYRIVGSYFGQFLGFLAGGAGGMMGDVHFLLDQNTGQLLAYSSDNPLAKTAHNLPGATVNPAANNQTIGQLNYYAGPGQDPRDSTRQMMYQVRATQMSTVTAQ